MKKWIMLLGFLCMLAITSQAMGSDVESRLQVLEETLKKQQKTIEEQQKIIDELRDQVRAQALSEKPKEAVTATEPSPQKPAGPSGVFGGSALSNPNISLVLNTYAYSSNLTNDELKNRGVRGYTTEGLDRKNGFNFDSAEIGIYAPVDPYFNLYATVPVTEDGTTVEEAYFVTTALPSGHQIKGGKFKSGFGRLNAQHSHVWDFVDNPLPYRAFIGFGDEGIDEKGVQYTYIPSLPFYTILGVEVLQGDNATLFGSDATGGPHAYTAFAKASLDVSDNATILFGPSVITGKTKTSTVAANSIFTGDTTLYGFEFTHKWKPSKYQGFKIQSEYLYRSQYGDLMDTTAGSIARLERYQDGFYVQGVYLWNRWEFGARYDLLSIFKDDYVLGGASQDLGRRPWRASAMIDYTFSEFSLLRLQYNHDESDVTGKVNHEVFLQALFSIGAHPAHQF
ncbi:MAG TPA: hypothetical protein VLZ07_00145 [Syntrophales bacterium]|nr:hypothetical protein [Syntrophales bacterium]